MISIIYPYYKTPDVIPIHLKIWKKLPPEFEVIVVDDGSTVPLPYFDLPNVRQFRVDVDIPWNYGAKNLGVYHAKNDWIFYSELDHVPDRKFLEGLLELPRKDCYYMFQRKNSHPDSSPQYSNRPHPATWFIERKRWWDVGGLDEDFAGFYGHDDTFFLMCLNHLGVKQVVSDLTLRNLSGNHEVKADLNGVVAKDATRNGKLLAKKIAEGKWKAENPIRFPWHEVNPKMLI